MRLYLVEKGKPFKGSIVSAMTDGKTVDYSGHLYRGQKENLTLAEYEDETGKEYEVLTDLQADKLFEEFEFGLITAPEVITEEAWDDALEVLPPCRWHSHRGVNMFHISERLTGDLVAWYGEAWGVWLTFTDSACATSDHLANKFATAILGRN